MPYIEERLARIEAYLGLAPYDPADPTNTTGGTTGPATPTFVTLVENANHSTTLSWTGNAPTYEVHEFLADPANTLKATVSTTSRTSGVLTVGNTYEYAVRSLDAQGNYSAFSQRWRITIGSGTGATGGTDPASGGGTTTGGTTGNTGVLPQFRGVGGVATPAGAVLETVDRFAQAWTITVGGTAGNPKVYDGQNHTVGRITFNAPYVVVQNYRINPQSQYAVVVNANDVTLQNCDIKGVRVSGDGDLNAITLFGSRFKCKYNTVVNYVDGDPGASHTDFIQTWVSSSHPNASSDNEIIGNLVTGPANPGRANSVASIHQLIMVESAGRGGNSGGSGTPSNWLILDNEWGASWGQDVKLDFGDNFVFARNKFVGSSDHVFQIGGSNNKVYGDNTFGSGYGDVGYAITAGNGPPTPPQGVAPNSGTTTGTGGTTTGGGTTGTTGGAPGQKFDLSRWYVTLPIAATDGSDTSGPWDIYNPRLKTFVHDRFFYLDAQGNLRLESPAKGVTTSAASGATRDEFREETATGNHAAWSTTDGKNHQLTVTCKVDPSSIDGRKEAITGQVHAAGGTPPLYLAVNHNSSPGTLRYFKNGPGVADLITGLLPTDIYTYRIQVNAGRCKVWAAKGDVTALPATPQVDFPASDFNETTGLYFKAGIYNKQDIASASTGSTFGTIYRLDLI